MRSGAKGDVHETHELRRPAHLTQPVRASARPEIHEYRLDLTVLEGPDEGAQFTVNAPSLTIGASPSCDVRLSDRWVSSVHCSISAHAGQYLLRDASSRNGTFIAGTRIVEAGIRPGTVLQLGASRVRFWSTESQDSLEISPHQAFGELVGTSTAMRGVFSLLERVAQSELTCLVHGETGTGKELCARAIHTHSSRADGPFIVIDCGSIGETLIADKLFGHERGAFTGAVSRALGAFEEARGGTVFLDEIGELPLRLQPKLLRVLERREIVRIGSHKSHPIDVRLVAATHRDLKQMVGEGEFRRDLYFRLSEAVVTLPPLRERLDDVDLLASEILKKESPCPPTLSRDASLYLSSRSWPGNVRELRNLVRRAASHATGDVIEAGLLADLHEPMTLEHERVPAQAHPQATPTGGELVGLELPIALATEAYREAYVRGVAARFSQDHAGLAEHMDVHLKYARRLLKRYGLE